METSPRDGVVFLAFVPHDQGGFAFAAVWNTAERLICMMGGDDFTETATHWMLLPEFPENDERMHHYQRRRTSITGLVL